MANNSKIEWCDATWNPIVGCSRVSKGCENCYAEKVAYRFKHLPKFGAVIKQNGQGWNGAVHFDENALVQPLKWKKPRRIFVCSMGDLFHEKVPNDWIDKVYAIMALCPQHTFMVLTKRPERMREYLSNDKLPDRVADTALDYCDDIPTKLMRKVQSAEFDTVHEFVQLAWYDRFPNVWLGVSVENQDTANERIPYLLDTPAAVRFISAEPLLGKIDLQFLHHGGAQYSDALLGEYDSGGHCGAENHSTRHKIPKLDWVIVGGESGKDARPMHPDWVRKIRDDCEDANVPFFFKQWGEFQPCAVCEVTKGFFPNDAANYQEALDRAKSGATLPRSEKMLRRGKKLAGNLLDGKKHLEYPKIGGA